MNRSLSVDYASIFPFSSIEMAFPACIRCTWHLFRKRMLFILFCKVCVQRLHASAESLLGVHHSKKYLNFPMVVALNIRRNGQFSLEN